MKSRVVVFASLVFASLVSLSILAAPNASAGGTLTGSTGHGSVSVQISDAVYDGPDCAPAPITITYSKTATEADSIYLSIEVEALQQGSNDPLEASESAPSYDKASGTLTTSMCVYPGRFPETAGPINLTGTLTSTYYVNDSSQTVKLAPAATLNLQKNPTSMTTPRIKKTTWSEDARTISGKITATTLTKGVIGADGRIEIYAKYPGSKRWVGGTSTSADEFGNWSTDVSKAPRGTQLKVVVTECGWCTNAQKTVKVTR